MTTASQRDPSVDEAAIRALIESIDRGLHRKDLAAITAPYAKDALIFDLAPPLSHRIDAGELGAWLDSWEGPVERESRDLDITVGGDLAFCTGFFRVSATPRAGGHAAWWMRATLCLQRDGGDWRIVHEHTSVPFRMDGSFQAAVDLEP